MHYNLNKQTSTSITLQCNDTLQYTYEENPPIGYRLDFDYSKSHLNLIKDKHHWWDSLKLRFTRKTGSAPRRRLLKFKATQKGQCTLVIYEKFRTTIQKTLTFELLIQ